MFSSMWVLVLLPLGITLLSNPDPRLCRSHPVLLPLGITLLSNWHDFGSLAQPVLLPLGITLLSNCGNGHLRAM